MLCHCLIFSVDVGEETPRTVCSGLVGSVPLEELQVWPFGRTERVDLKKTNKQTSKNKKLAVVHLIHVYTCKAIL